ncbi:MAG: site-specific integrase [bacterium]|nr:site-specific integrase [bacterium]
MGVFTNKRRGKNGKTYGICYRDAQGRLHQRIVSNDKDEAKKALTKAMREVDQGLHRPDARKVVFGTYARTWLEGKKAEIRPTTWRAYRTHVLRHMLDPDIGLSAVRFHKITLPLLRSFRTALIDPSRELSPKSVNAVLTTLGCILDQARKDGFLTVNPARDLKKLPVPHREMDFLQPFEVAPLLEQANVTDKTLHVAVTLAIFTGLRRSELLALRFEDIVDDGSGSYLRVTRTYHGKGRFEEPKTQRSRRNVSIPSFVLRTIRGHRLRQGNPSGEGLIFDNGTGQPLDPDHLSKTLWKRLLRSAGVRESLRWHDLRHTYASLMLAEGVNMNVIKTQMGHSSISVTMDRYAHLMPSACQDAADKLQESVFKDANVDNVFTIQGGQ